MVSHRNIIANTLQIIASESNHRASLKTTRSQSTFTDIALGLLPQSHLYGLVCICHAGPYRGDQTVVLPKFNLGQYLSAVQTFNIMTLFLVSVHSRRGTSIDCY
jgi:acyl-CoA synthetase (AMP-forming)/AMP-acid ligase II